MQRLDILDGIKILDLSRIFTGPYCTQLLADLGAEVIKIEPPKGDDTRYWGPPFIKKELSSYYVTLNRNKKNVVLDLKNEKDLKKLKKLVKWADVLVENYREGVTKKLRITPEELWKINPKLIYLSIRGFGSKGPYVNRAAYDIIAQSETGIMGMTGTKDGQIVKVAVPIGDIAAALYGAIGILAAVYKAQKTGRGIHIETSLFSSLLSWLTYQAANAYLKHENICPMGTEHANIVPYQSFLCKDGKWISIAIGNEKQWEKFCQAIERSDLINNPKYKTNAKRVKNRNSLVPLLSNIFLQKTCDEWEEILLRYSLPVGKVRTILEVLEHPQAKALDLVFFLEFLDENKKIPLFKTPLSFSNAGKKIFIPPSEKGKHQEIIKEISDF